MPSRDSEGFCPAEELSGNESLSVPGVVWLQSWNLKKLTEGHHKAWSLRLNLTQHGKTHPVRTPLGLTDWKLFLDLVVGGAWPFLVGGVICLVYSDNERDSSLLNRTRINLFIGPRCFLEELAVLSRTRLSDNRSVMPLDVRGCTRATLEDSTCSPSPKGVGKPLKFFHVRDRVL